MATASLPPPVGGWNAFDPLMGMKSGYAVTLDNLIPDEGQIRVRPGCRTWATGLPARVGGLLSYRSGGSAHLFAASGTGLYDVTSPGAVGAPVVTGLTSSQVDSVQVAAAGGSFLLAFNGADPVQQFNGTAWSAWAATGIGFPIGWAGAFKGQVYCGRRDKLSFWYGPPASIAGAFVEFPLQGVAKRGGGLCGMADWTHDGGQGPEDYLALFTTEGEVIVFQGQNPSSALSFALVGVFATARPIGSRFARQFGGDVLVLTEGGVFPLSALVGGVDEAALGAKAYTRKIEPVFLDLSRGRGDQQGWALVPLQSYGLWLVNVPWGGTDAQQIAFRATTGACSRLTGQPAACWIETGGRAYFGTATGGRVMLWGEDDGDDGAAISWECVQAFADFGGPGVKQWQMAMPILSDVAGASVRVEMALDWRIPVPEVVARGPGAPPVQVNAAAAVARWDMADWDAGTWAGDGEVVRVWRSINGIGQAAAFRLRGASVDSRPGWLGTNFVLSRGGPLR